MSEQSKPSIFGRVTAFLLTLVVIAGAGAAVVSGAGALAERADAVTPPTAAPATPVRVRPVSFSDGYTVLRRFIGQVEAGAEAALSFELGGKLIYLSADEGETVNKGQIIARLDTALLRAEQARLAASRDATAALLTLAESRLNRASALRSEGFASQETVDQTLATRNELTSRMAEIDASLATVAINLEKSVLVAPFSGRVGAQNVEISETMSAGQPVVSLIETTNPVVRVGLPLHLDPDALDRAEIAIGDAVLPARLSQLRPDIDPLTRTRTALFTVDTDLPLAFGQTAALIVATRVAARGAWVPLDALQEGAGSIWTVLVVQDGIVRTANVEVLHAQSDRAFVRGTFVEGAQMIRDGAHRVVPGQQVSLLQGGE